MFCLTEAGDGFVVSRCPPEMVEQLVSQPRKFHPPAPAGAIPLLCLPQLGLSPVSPRLGCHGDRVLSRRGDAAEVLGLPNLALIAEKASSFRSSKQIALPAGARAKPVPFAGCEGNAGRFVGEDAGTHIELAG